MTSRLPASILRVPLSLFLLLLLPALAFAATSTAGRLVFSQGDVAVSAGNGAWEPASTGRDLAAGDSVRTGPGGRAAILCADETQLRLGENTLITLKAVAASSRLGLVSGGSRPSDSVYDMKSGEAWLRNNNETSHFRLETPAMTAAVRGTEFTATVGRGGATDIALLDGKLLLSNAQGSLDLDKGELGHALPGQAPTKQVLVNPEDAVQWVLYYPTAISWRDITMAGLSAGPLTRAEEALDEGYAGRVDSLAGGDASPAGFTARGWAALRGHRPAEALALFDKAGSLAKSPSARTLSGRWLALAQSGHAVRAWEESRLGVAQLAPTAELYGLNAYLALAAGQPAAARESLNKALALSPGNAFCRSLASQMDLAQNRKDLAMEQARQAVAANPQSPSARVALALAFLSRFELDEAMRELDAAIRLDPACVSAYVYKARIQLGSDAPDKALATADKALSIAPDDPMALSLAGFAKLGMRRFDDAQALFDRSLSADPGQPEPHMGLGMAAFSRNQKFAGLSEMLSATLLDPRVSLYQTSLGKGYYTARAFDKAMASYDQAASLDKADPTPHLYKGIALTDLYQPGAAVEEFNKSIALNDNRAMFRSRLLLDRDLAVRNFDLAKAYVQLGLGDWAFAKAVTSVKKDPFESSAHLFLSGAYASTRQRVSAASSELLLYRLLSPANQNSFTVYNDYTPMFEAPYLRTQLVSAGGLWANGNPTADASAEVYGGVPGMAADGYVAYSQDNGMRRSQGISRSGFAFGQFKWEPTFRDAFYAAVTLSRAHTPDVSNQSAWEYRTSPWQTNDYASTDTELAYVRRFKPGWTFIAYGAAKWNAWDFKDRVYAPADAFLGDLPLDDVSLRSRQAPSRHVNIQAQQQLTVGSHSIVVGGDAFSSTLDYRNRLHFIVPLLPQFSSLTVTNHDYWTRSLTVYAQDYWQAARGLTIEAGLSGEFATTSRFAFSSPVDDSLLGFRFGVNWEATEKDVLRLALQRYLNTHITDRAMIQPSEVAGFPTRVNADDGSRVMEAGVAWERQWDDKTFSSLRGDWHHIENPQFDPLQLAYERKLWLVTDRYLMSASVNRVLTPYLGANLVGVVKWLEPDQLTLRRSPESRYFEFDGGGGLTFLYKNGLGASLSGLLVKQTFPENLARDLLGRHRDENPFFLLGASVSYQFPAKRGFVSLEGTNLLDVKFSYQREPVTLDSFSPSRKLVLRLGFYF